MEIIETTSANYLVEHDDGSIASIGKSPLNRALIEHDLWGLLRDGDEVLVLHETEERPQITLIPGDNAKEYTLRVGDYEGLHLGPHKKSMLVEALVDGQDAGDEDTVARELLALYDSIRENQVRSVITSALVEREPFASYVEDTSDGWLIHDHLLLTWENDFHHPGTTSYDRSGSTVIEGSSEQAYKLSIPRFDNESTNKDLTIDDQQYRLTNAEMEFLARALWAIENAPREV